MTMRWNGVRITPARQTLGGEVRGDVQHAFGQQSRDSLRTRLERFLDNHHSLSDSDMEMLVSSRRMVKMLVETAVMSNEEIYFGIMRQGGIPPYIHEYLRAVRDGKPIKTMPKLEGGNEHVAAMSLQMRRRDAARIIATDLVVIATGRLAEIRLDGALPALRAICEKVPNAMHYVDHAHQRELLEGPINVDALRSARRPQQ